MLKGRGISFALALGMSLLSSVEALAFPLTSERPWGNQGSVGFVYEEGFHFPGIVAMSNCSASFVRFKGASDDDLGLLLTNGHCVGGGIFGGGMLKPGEVYYQKPKKYSVDLLNLDGSKITTLRSEKIIYATMTDTDMAVLELTKSYREIERTTGVKPLLLADSKPVPGTAMEIPSGYWNRTYSCDIEAFVHTLREGDWTFKDSIRYSESGCEVVGGTSGSPIVSPASGEVIGINNTTNESGRSCTLNNPCEVDENGKTQILRGRGYGQQTFNLYSCLNANHQVDLAVSGCVLPKP